MAGRSAPEWLHNDVSGPAKSTDHDPVVSIKVPTRGPYGVLLEETGGGVSAQIKGFERVPSGKFGPVQRHGGVRVGDILVGVNETPTDSMPFTVRVPRWPERACHASSTTPVDSLARLQGPRA